MTPEERQRWLAQRRTGVGSSDAAALCNLSPFEGDTPLGVYLDKLGLRQKAETPEMAWGTLKEDLVARAFASETGLAVLPSPGLLRHPHHTWMLATPDRLLPTEQAVLEVKCTGRADGWGLPGTDEVPEHYLLQVQHQMAVLGAGQAYLAVLIGHADFRWYAVPRHQALIDRLIAIEAAFWKHVERRQPPEMDWSHPDTPRLVELLWRPDPARSVDLPAEALWHADEYVRLGSEARALEKERERHKAQLLVQLQEAGVGRLPDGREVVRSTYTKKTYHVAEHQETRFTIRNQRRKNN